MIPPDCMRQVLAALRESFDILPEAEFTSEANPGTLTPEWLQVMRQGGVNRLSLGVQAAQDGLLKRIGRIHTAAQAEEAVLLARQNGFDNINVDLMYGLPGQTQQDYLASIRKAAEWGVKHISAYSLIL